MKTPQASLMGVGVASPRGGLGQDAAIELALQRCTSDERQQAWLRRVYRHTRVQRRGSVLLRPGEGAEGFENFFPPPLSAQDRGPTTATRLQRYAKEAGPLAERACREALRNSQVEPHEITHLVTVTCTGLVAPGLDSELPERLGLSADIGRLNLGFMGCHGALNGMRAASGLVRELPEARVLLCCVELCSLHFQYGWDPQKIVANGLFADGAGAAILGPADSQAQGWQLIEAQSRIAQHSSNAMTWSVGDHGFEMTLSSEVPKLIRASLGEWMQSWLARHDMSVRDVAHWAIHPGGPDILQAVTQALSLPEQADAVSREVLAEHGNMSSPTVLFVLERLRAQAACGPCVMLGFGPGLAFEGVLLA
ncbi:type III polyketide synthase [Vreelandella rituensis]|uniref:Type III polyketide synthase n=1 Tax=Vreelandella rituensis TaxID=2282306 RepID=A0A368U6M0_9GAMM|nr:type III polyketide synthase [Halomonas rituensis]RCV92770.1 type III polyketide synthase [Halomonas rituensis]